MPRSLWWDVSVDSDLCLTVELSTASGEFGSLAILEGDDCDNLSCIAEGYSSGTEVAWKATKGKSYAIAYGMYEYMFGSDFDFRLRVSFDLFHCDTIILSCTN
jgi:hypothetical protein